MNRVFLGCLMALLALLGLTMAAKAGDEGMFVAGMLFFLFGVGYNFWLIARAYPAH
jgi:hypothetical protein